MTQPESLESGREFNEPPESLLRLRTLTFLALTSAFLVELLARSLSKNGDIPTAIRDSLSLIALLCLCFTVSYLIFHLPNQPKLKVGILLSSTFMLLSETLNITEDFSYFAGVPFFGSGMPGHDPTQDLLLVAGILLMLVVVTIALIEAVAAEQGLARERRVLAAEIQERKRAEAALEVSQEELRELSSHLEAVREEERKRIAREIHDELGQTLTILKLDIAALEAEVRGTDNPEAASLVASMNSALDQTMHSVRKIITELRPGILDDLGLIAAMEWQGRDFHRRTSIPCTIQASSNLAMSSEQATALFRIFQEALTNVARHSGATVVEVALNNANNQVVLSIRDNGHGMPEEGSAKKDSFGLIGIRERVRQFGGKLEIISAPGTGTTVSVTLPL
ncbi:MAG: sensor histidine kinase [Candidatus Hydrogenedentes bacterium]|nr:sensor histidine kinase [Candidatus Hydrogenedentota bacterium]